MSNKLLKRYISLKKTDLTDIPEVSKCISITKDGRTIVEKMSNSTDIEDTAHEYVYSLFIYNVYIIL